MKRASTYLLVLLLIATGCVEEVDVELDQYVKVLSLDRSSFAEKIVELENGDLLILGEMGTSAFDLESNGQGSEPGDLEDQAPFMAMTDQNGNLKMLRMYPFERARLAPPFNFLEVLNGNNITSFLSAIPTNDGGFVIHAQSLGFDFLDTRTGQVLESEPGRFFYNDYLIKVNANLDVVKIQTMQGYPGWDGVNRIRGNLKRLRENEIGFLLSQRSTLLLNQDSRSRGYTFLHLTDDLDTLRVSDVQRQSELIGHDFDFDGSGTLSILGTTDSNFEVFQGPINAINENSSSTVIAGDGVLNSQNRDENYIRRMSDGTFILVYTQPPLGIVMEHRASDMSLINGPHFIGEASYPNFTIRATRAVYITSDNQVLMYVLNIPGSADMNLSGELFKVTLSGETVFRKIIDGVPGDVIETRDGSIITASNAIYNGSLQKIHISKLNKDGELF